MHWRNNENCIMRRVLSLRQVLAVAFIMMVAAVSQIFPSEATIVVSAFSIVERYGHRCKQQHRFPQKQERSPLNSWNTIPSFNLQQQQQSRRTLRLLSTTMEQESSSITNNNEEDLEKNNKNKKPKIVLVAGFESFNRQLYEKAARELNIDLCVFADSDIRTGEGINSGINVQFETAIKNADAFIGSLIFDYDDVLIVKDLLHQVNGPRFVFESATELMTFNRVGSFSMEPTGDDGPAGPPPAVKAVLSKFSSGKEEDKINGYLKLLKIGPTLLKYVPGEKANDLRNWLEAYRFWNQGGKQNVQSMLQLIAAKCNDSTKTNQLQLPDVFVTPDVGLLHPVMKKMDGSHTYFESPASYLKWRTSERAYVAAEASDFHLAPVRSPKVAILLYRKHVITEQRYIMDLITMMESQGIIPVPIFINGVEAHTIVRDILTSDDEINSISKGLTKRDETYQPYKAVSVDAIINTIGFPLVGGPAGSIEAGRNVDVSAKLLKDMNVPYVVAGPLLLQSIQQWKKSGVLGLQSVALYSLPELDGAIDTVVLGGLVGDKIALVPERVRKVTGRIKGWIKLRQTPVKERKIAISLYGFPPNVGAVGTAALLDVPQSLENLLRRLHKEGYDVGTFATDPNASGESLVAALSILCEDSVVAAGASNMQVAVDAKIERAQSGDETVAATLSNPGGGLGGATVRAIDVSMDELDTVLGKYMTKSVRRAWPENGERGPGVSSKGSLVVSGIQVGNVWITVQPLLGLEGDPMRLLFERDLTPHPQYCAAYEWMRLDETLGGIGSQAVIHLGMHGTVEWLPGQPLGNDRKSWSDELLGDLPNIYVYAANNPSESILAKRRGYGTLVSYNVPPYSRSGLYLELSNLKELIDEHRQIQQQQQETNESGGSDLQESIWASVQKSGLARDVPPLFGTGESNEQKQGASDTTDAEFLFPTNVSNDVFDEWVNDVADYLSELQNRLFSTGLHVLGRKPNSDALVSYLEAYYGTDKISIEKIRELVQSWKEEEVKRVQRGESQQPLFEAIVKSLTDLFTFREDDESKDGQEEESVESEARKILSLLSATSEETESIVNALDGGFVPAAPGGDLLRDGPSVLPTGRNIHALDPYRMPSAGAWVRGQKIASSLIQQHQDTNNGEYPETIAVTLWGLDAIKTRGESVAIALALVGAEPVKEGTGRIVRFDLVSLEKLGRPRIDVLASLSGIFRDSFANVVDLLDDMFERAAVADEPPEMNFVKKHAMELTTEGEERPAARLFSNPPGDYGSMVNEVVGSGDWEESESLGETWTTRNVFSYGRNEKSASGDLLGTARPKVLDKLLETTERIVQEVDSVEYGLTDIQEYYANTGALKKAAENRKSIDAATGKKKKVALSIVEAFTGGDDDDDIPVRDVESVLRLEYRSKLLNPKWTEAMVNQGSGGAYEVSQRFTAMVGWAATSEVDNFVFEQAAERYALDDEVASKLQKANPEAFKNVIRRLLEASGRGMWSTDEETLDKLRELYSDTDDLVERGSSTQ